MNTRIVGVLMGVMAQAGPPLPQGVPPQQLQITNDPFSCVWGVDYPAQTARPLPILRLSAVQGMPFTFDFADSCRTIITSQPDRWTMSSGDTDPMTNAASVGNQTPNANPVFTYNYHQPGTYTATCCQDGWGRRSEHLLFRVTVAPNPNPSELWNESPSVVATSYGPLLPTGTEALDWDVAVGWWGLSQGSDFRFTPFDPEDKLMRAVVNIGFKPCDGESPIRVFNGLTSGAEFGQRWLYQPRMTADTGGLRNRKTFLRHITVSDDLGRSTKVTQTLLVDEGPPSGGYTPCNTGAPVFTAPWAGFILSRGGVRVNTDAYPIPLGTYVWLQPWTEWAGVPGGGPEPDRFEIWWGDGNVSGSCSVYSEETRCEKRHLYAAPGVYQVRYRIFRVGVLLDEYERPVTILG